MKSFVVCMLVAAAGTARADTVLGVDLGATVRDYAAYQQAMWGEGAFLHAGISYRLSDHAWIEPGGAMRFASVSYPDGLAHDTTVDLLAGLRIGANAEGVRPWVGGYAGYAHRGHSLESEGTSMYSGLALDAAIGVDFDIRTDLRATLRVDLAGEKAPYAHTYTWYAMTGGFSYVF